MNKIILREDSRIDEKELLRRKRISEAMKGRLPSNINKIAGWNKGLPSTFVGDKSPNWKGGRPTQICKKCGNKFLGWIYRKQKYCSKECSNQDKIGCSSWNKGLKGFMSGTSHYLFGKKRSKEVLKKISDALKGRVSPNKGKPCLRKGELSNFWRGGVTPINIKIRGSLEYKLWRRAVFERDNYTCVWCGARNGNGKTVVLNADHIKAFAYYPELRFAIDNGRTLCLPCHKRTDNYSGKNHKRTK